MHLTNHARRRRGRTGLKKKTLDEQAGKAYTLGLRRYDVNGKLRRYMDSLRYGRNETKVRIYGNMVWIFKGNVLITVYPLPHEYQVIAAKKLRGKNA